MAGAGVNDSPDGPDPFTHHPVLRDKIADPLTSVYRTLTLADIDARLEALGLPTDWHFTEAEIEASHRKFFADQPDQDLWVFAYGSLMWDPAFRFAEVRRGRIAGYARRFILKDIHGARGTRETPGLMAALDEGTGCDGLVFRIAKEHLMAESWIVWRREMIVSAYKPVFAEVSTAFGTLKALTFAADYQSEMICPDLTRAEQVHFITTGSGFLGSSLQYIENVAAHFEALGVEDIEVSELLAEIRTYLAARTPTFR